MDSQWFEIDDVLKIHSPALVIYPERVKENIKRMVAVTGDATRLMPHVKTHKTKEIAEMQIQEGIHKFKCATLAEAEMLGLAGAKEVLIAYQPVGPNCNRVKELCLKYSATHFSVVVDNKESLSTFAKIIGRLEKKPGIYIDLNTGMNRTGILPDKGAEELFEFGLSHNNVRMLGFHAYDGQIHDSDLAVREEKCEAAFRAVYLLKNRLEEKHKMKLILVAGGTPTFPIHARNPEIICSPGTSVFWDYGYQNAFSDLDFLPAALLLTRVISKPAQDLICLDLGYKSVASENPLPRVKFLNHPEVTPVSQSEEHLVVNVGNSNNYKIGDPFYAIPKHICPTVALYSEAEVIINKKTAGQWKIIARNRKISI